MRRVPPAAASANAERGCCRSRGRPRAPSGNLTGRYLEWLDQAGDGDPAERRLADLAWTAGIGRSHFDHRAALVFSDAASLSEQLRALADAGDGVEPGGRTKVAFAYTGQGSQWAGHGRGALRVRAGGALGAGPLRGGVPGGAGDIAPGRDVRARRIGPRPRRHRLGTAGALRARVRADRALGERGHPPRRGDGTQRRRDRGRPHGGSVLARDRNAVRRRPGNAPVRNRSGRHGGGLRSGGAGRGGRRGVGTRPLPGYR